MSTVFSLFLTLSQNFHLQVSPAAFIIFVVKALQWDAKAAALNALMMKPTGI